MSSEPVTLAAAVAAASDGVPGVKLLGLVLGILLMVAAIRGLFGRRK